MTDTPPGRQRPTFSEHGQSFSEWLEEHKITEDGDPKPTPATKPEPAQTARLAPDIRAALWTLPLGIISILGGYLVPHFTAHGPGAVRRLIGLALIAWVISIGCELKAAYALRDAYPPLGMWQWLMSPRLSRSFNRGEVTATRAANNGCALTALAALAVPGVFAAFYICTALMAVAIQIFITVIVVTSIAHIGVTLSRHQHKERR